MPVRTKRIYDLPSPGDGTRVLVMRFYPRGIRRSAFHERRKELSPEPPLLRAWKARRITWREFARRFKAQMAGDALARASLEELAHRAKRERLTLLCGCEDEAHCHRTLLKAMLERKKSAGDSSCRA